MKVFLSSMTLADLVGLDFLMVAMSLSIGIGARNVGKNQDEGEAEEEMEVFHEGLFELGFGHANRWLFRDNHFLRGKNGGSPGAEGS